MSRFSLNASKRRRNLSTLDISATPLRFVSPAITTSGRAAPSAGPIMASAMEMASLMRSFIEVRVSCNCRRI